MLYTLCFWWNSSRKEICYVVFDENFGLAVPFVKKNILNTGDVDQVFQDLLNLVSDFELKIEYKILHASPVVQLNRNLYSPNALSSYINEKFMNTFRDRNKIQLRKFLKKPQLRIFSKGLKRMDLVSIGEAWKEKLYMMSVHATSSNYKKGLKKIWKSMDLVVAGQGSETRQFQSWLASL